MSGTNMAFAPPGTAAEVEEGAVFTPRFGPDGLMPCIAVDAATGEVLMLAYMSTASLARTLETGEAWYWSRSRGELWRKGATSGQLQTVVEMRVDCDQDTLLIKVRVAGDGDCCHTGRRSCFYRTVPIEAPEGGPVGLQIAPDEDRDGSSSLHRHERTIS